MLRAGAHLRHLLVCIAVIAVTCGRGAALSCVGDNGTYVPRVAYAPSQCMIGARLALGCGVFPEPSYRRA
jgi:hypothetical protein